MARHTFSSSLLTAMAEYLNIFQNFVGERRRGKSKVDCKRKCTAGNHMCNNVIQTQRTVMLTNVGLEQEHVRLLFQLRETSVNKKSFHCS